MPILSLLLFVVITSSENFIVTQYRRRITYGLVFSSMGDLLLNFDLFEAGMGAFGIAQVYYILAFGLKPLKLWIGATLYALGFMAISLFYGNLNTIIKLCLPFYAILLLTMCWRSLARIEGSHIYIMGTYYIAQLGITLSINDLQLRESTTTKKTY
uniref:lysoplasmalogenase n=1 Tax=Anopheles dirus TaxID=7168 RepID=A0A182NN67_9DIPT